jgi:hypothetical protein
LRKRRIDIDSLVVEVREKCEVCSGDAAGC